MIKGILRPRLLISIRCGNFLWSAAPNGEILEDVYSTGLVWQSVENMGSDNSDAVCLLIHRGSYIRNAPLLKFVMRRSEIVGMPTLYKWRYIND